MKAPLFVQSIGNDVGIDAMSNQHFGSNLSLAPLTDSAHITFALPGGLEGEVSIFLTFLVLASGIVG